MEKGKVRLILLLAVFAVLTITITIIFWPFIKNLRNPEYIENFSNWIQSKGFAGIAVLFGIQVMQVVVAVFPGGPVQVVAGMAYGAIGGLAIIISGVIVSSTIIFILVRKFGQPLLRRFFGEEEINKWKFLQDTKKVARVVFILFLIPGMPKDLLAWLTPLTGLSLPMFVVLCTVARIPAILSSTIMGGSLTEGKWILTISIFLGVATAGFLGMWFRDRITKKIGA